jgi:hypothetical protein
MSTMTWTDEDTARAERFWNEYQQNHDLSGLRGQVAGIDPNSGKVWIAESAKAIVAERKKAGEHSLLFFVRVGYDYHVRKGARR